MAKESNLINLKMTDPLEFKVDTLEADSKESKATEIVEEELMLKKLKPLTLLRKKLMLKKLKPPKLLRKKSSCQRN